VADIQKNTGRDVQMVNGIKDRVEALDKIYASFKSETADYRREAACRKGCAFCCTVAGSVDITTLKGLIIRDTIAGMPRARQTQIKKALNRDMKKREAGNVMPCPFLMKNRACMIYSIRPFACRRVYSLHVCTRNNPPRLHRQVMERGAETIRILQRQDENGYSGHLSYILHMLDTPRFLDTYTAGESRPEEIMAFGKSHGIVINKMVV